MMPLKIRTSLALAILCAAIVFCRTIAAQVTGDASRDHAERSRIAFSHALPKLDSSHLVVTVVEVTYGPGESSPPHSHPCAVVGYVVNGALRTQVKGEAEAVYKTGESFYEAPNGIHQVSANASLKKPVKFIAYFVCDHDTPLSAAVPAGPSSGGQQP
ncbi:MAG: cupin domain-containing protein [Candidatus Sulfotelmatobacter sp.]